MRAAWLIVLLLAVAVSARHASKKHHRHASHSAEMGSRKSSASMKADMIAQSSIARIEPQQITATKAWSAKWLGILAKAPSRPNCYNIHMPNSGAAAVSAVNSEMEKVDKWRCQGCMNTVTTLMNFMKVKLDAGNAVEAFQEFGAVCQYSDPEFSALCQYMFELLPTDIPSMIVQEVMPVDICSCFQFCRANEREIYVSAFRSFTAEEPEAAPLPATIGGNSAANLAANKQLHKGVIEAIKTQPPKPICYAALQNDRRAFNDVAMHAVGEHVNKWRCDGCVDSVVTLFNHMRPILKRGGSTREAAEEFGRACQYVSPQFVEVCQNLFEVHPDRVIGMIFEDVMPIDICVCLQNCRINERDVYTRAFSTLSSLPLGVKSG